MLNYLKSHLTAKIFLITAAMLLNASAVTYGFITLYTPGRYLIAVEENISREAEELMDEIGQADKEAAQEMLEQFSNRHSVTVTMKTADEEGESTVRADEESAFAEPDTVAIETAPGQGAYHISVKEPKVMYEFQYKDSPHKYTLSIEGISHTTAPLTTALNQVLFPLMAIVFILALIVSAFYSKYITRPVIEISEASKRMASLDFDILCDESRNDELGVLSGNLNELSRCLSAAMEDLNHANALLEEIPGLFESFTRREQSRNRETGGSGLGLFIVWMVLELHHFSYGMENTQDGIRFSIVLAE